MGSNYGILAGLLGGFGGAAQQIGGAFTRQQEEQLAREKLAIEQQRADQAAAQNQAVIAESQATRTQNQRQFDTTQSALDAQRFTLLPASAMPAGYQGQPDANGMVKVQVAAMPALTKMREDEVTQGRYGALQDYLRGRKGSPATPDAAMAPEGSMYSEQEVSPGAPAVAARPVDPNDLAGLLAGMPGGAELAKILVPAATQKFGIHGGNAAGSPTVIYNQQTGEVSQSIPGVDPALKPKVTVREYNTQEGVIREATDETGKVVSRERVGSPVQQPREPAQPSASSLLDTTMRQYQAARAQFGPDDQRTKDLAERAAALKSYVVAPGGDVVGPAGTGTRTAGPEKPNVIGDLLSGKYAQPGAPAAAPKPAAPAAQQQGTRVRDPRTGRTGTVPPGQPIPAGVEVIR